MHTYLKDVGNGDTFKGVYLLKSVQQGVTQKGDLFWSIKLADASTQLDCKIWSPLAQEIKEMTTGSFVSIEAKAQTYRDNVQLVLNSFRTLEEDEVQALDLGHYIPTSPYPLEDMRAELNAIIKKNIVYKPWKNFIKYVLNDERIAPYFYTAPGAKSVHHAYLHGLLEHTLGVVKNCLALCGLYPKLDKQILIVTALFHDIGKIVELSGPLATEYTHSGKLIGHIVLGLEMVDPYFKKAKVDPHLILHYKHLILSHHGELEFGSPKTPATAEAFILHYADNIDAKMAQVFQAIPEESTEDDMTWAPWNNLLGRQLCRVNSTPKQKNTDKENTQKRKQEEQCSLL